MSNYTPKLKQIFDRQESVLKVCSRGARKKYPVPFSHFVGGITFDDKRFC
ncbi:MAG: hypothetical protein ACUVXA_16080 [Candidatus Jordarchaeum sp.]